MKIARPQSGDEWLAQSAIRNPQSAISNCILAHPTGESLSRIKARMPLPTSLAIGPEGGFTDEEVATALAAGWQAVTLGPRILRVETAAVALTAAMALS
jgi:16S rRNA (uracil1498-N3)-methyltransferase